MPKALECGDEVAAFHRIGTQSGDFVAALQGASRCFVTLGYHLPMPLFKIRPATEEDIPLILTFIRDLARYEKLEHEVVATEETLRETLFGQPRFAEVLFGEEDGTPVAFALFFHNYSTFVGRPGLYLEDLFVKPECRGRGYGKAMLARLAAIAVERDCGRFEWAVLDWNTPAIDFYKALGARAVDEWTIFRMTGEALHKLAAHDR